MTEIAGLAPEDGVFDPARIAVLHSALELAWDQLANTASELARPAYAQAAREVLARRIIESARQGIEDPLCLADDALRFVIGNYLTSKAPKRTRPHRQQAR